MACDIIETNEAPAAIGPYSQAVASGSMLFVSGQLGMNPETGELGSSDFQSQTEQAMINLHNIIQAGGFDLSDVMSVDVFITDMKRFAEFNEIYLKYFFSHKPARAIVEVSALPKGAVVEIKCVAKR